MSGSRQLPASDYARLKAATRDLVKMAGGPNRASTVTRVVPSKLTEYGSPHLSTHMPLDVIADLEADVGEPVVTSVLADLMGFVLVPKAATKQPDQTIAASMGEVAKDVGDVLCKLGAALSDGSVTVEEALKILPSVREAETELSELEEALEAKSSVVPLGRAS